MEDLTFERESLRRTLIDAAEMLEAITTAEGTDAPAAIEKADQLACLALTLMPHAIEHYIKACVVHYTEYSADEVDAAAAAAAAGA